MGEQGCQDLVLRYLGFLLQILTPTPPHPQASFQISNSPQLPSTLATVSINKLY